MDKTLTQINLEVLRLAKELVENEYLDYRAKVHNQWLTESDIAWTNEGKKLPYPTINPYPTEIQIVERAKLFLDFLKSGNVNISETTLSAEKNDADPISEMESSKSADSVPEDKPVTQPSQSVKKPKVPLPPEDTIEWARSKTNRYEQNDESSFGSVIPELLKSLNTVNNGKVV